MNDKKVAFIYCVSNSSLYQESARYLKNLKVPEGYEIELIGIENVKNISEGYNQAMMKTDAKYKVYLHQDVFIINKEILYNTITIFEQNPQLGMIGVAGAKTIPRSGIWMESTQCFGKFYDTQSGSIELLNFKEVEQDYESVQVLDGLIMMTQYDIQWKEKLFSGNFYEMPQCQEYLLAGYEIGIIQQNEPWCIHDREIVNEKYDSKDDIKRFFDIYGENVQKVNEKYLPLVSILIPTYNRPFYFEHALQSALNQTYENIEIMVCDDSTNHETEELIKQYTNKYNNIFYSKNSAQIGQFENDIKLFNLSNGEYINYLMDDDLMHSEKIEKMMTYFINDQNNEIKLVTSVRKMIDERGNQLSDNVLTNSLFEVDTTIDGTELVDFVIKNNFNCIGEPTTVLFRKADLKVPFGTFAGRKYGCNVDQATWFTLLSKGKAVYIAQALSYFRIHSNQQLQSTKMLLDGALDYTHEVLYAREEGFLHRNEDYLSALRNCRNYLSRVKEQINDDPTKNNESFNELLKVFNRLNEEIDFINK